MKAQDEESASSEFFLPSGELLRGILNHSSITPSLLRRLLRKRGIFIDSTEKADLVPFFLFSYLNSSEFDEILDCGISRSESLKVRNEKFKNVNLQKTLNESIPEVAPADGARVLIGFED